MANIKISALTSATTPLAGTEVVPIVQSSVTKQVSVENLVKATQPGSSANAVQYLNGSKVPTTSANFIYDGTNLVNGYTSAVVGVSGYTPTVQSITGDTNSSGFGVYGYTSGGVPRMQINRSKSTTKGTNTAVASGDNIGLFHYGGADGTGFIEAVRLTGQVDAAVSTNIVPGCYIISTMNTSGTMVESTRFSSNQYVGINTSATPARRLEIKQDGAPGLRITNTTGGAGQGIELLTATTKKSWLLGAQYNVDQAFEITPSTANGGTTFTTPACVFITTAIYPGADNTSSCGTSGNRWSVVYAATGTINTSDANQKQQIRFLTDAEKAVASRLKSLIKAFKFNDAVAKKGDAARIHVGVLAQDVRAAFEAEGLDATQYGVFCSDTTKGGLEQLSVRYEELFAFVLTAV